MYDILGFAINTIDFFNFLEFLEFFNFLEYKKQLVAGNEKIVLVLIHHSFHIC